MRLPRNGPKLLINAPRGPVPPHVRFALSRLWRLTAATLDSVVPGQLTANLVVVHAQAVRLHYLLLDIAATSAACGENKLQEGFSSGPASSPAQDTSIGDSRKWHRVQEETLRQLDGAKSHSERVALAAGLHQ